MYEGPTRDTIRVVSAIENRARVLIVDDDDASRALLVEILRPEGHECVCAASGAEALAIAASQQIDAVALDLDMPGMDGVQVLERLRKSHPGLPVIILTGSGSIRTAVQTTELGAFAYLVKSLDMDQIVVVLRRALERRALAEEVEALRAQLGSGANLVTRMGPSAAVRRLVDQVRQVAASNFSVLIAGETGTGKELVSRAVHDLSDRAGRPFVAIDCGAIPESLMESEMFGHERGAFTGAVEPRPGYIQAAEGGTLFLDEITNLPLAMQGKLLRVLQEKELRPIGGRRTLPFDVRIVAASNRDLATEAREGRFRQDLYFRLAEFTIQLTPLRERREDIPYLVRRFAEEAAIELRRPVREILPEALALLVTHPWTGNVRELRNVIRHAVLESDGLVLATPGIRRALDRSTGTQTPPARDVVGLGATRGKSLKDIGAEAAAEAEKAAIRAALHAARGNKSEAARSLRTDFKTLHLKIRRFGLEEPAG